MLLLPLEATALSPEERGLEIALEADSRDTGFKDFKASLHIATRWIALHA